MKAKQKLLVAAGGSLDEDDLSTEEGSLGRLSSLPLEDNEDHGQGSLQLTNDMATIFVPTAAHIDPSAVSVFTTLFPGSVYDIMETPSNGLRCGFEAMILSFCALFPHLKAPTVEELQEIFDDHNL